MARIVKPEHKHHAFRLRSDARNGELLIVRGNSRTFYVWSGPDSGITNGIMTFSGRVALRKFAQRILKFTK